MATVRCECCISRMYTCTISCGQPMTCSCWCGWFCRRGRVLAREEGKTRLARPTAAGPGPSWECFPDGGTHAGGGPPRHAGQVDGCDDSRLGARLGALSGAPPAGAGQGGLGWWQHQITVTCCWSRLGPAAREGGQNASETFIPQHTVGERA